ncbi:MAG TPA: Rv0909 family putative TA system antitoxin [Brevibacterium sp.]|nr:Rv0909 family putative TA system antitoxin [Brevibacterium sp.]HLS34361.1 Rv0909 family putative TA system antitoxin [Brevibacterium sp.]
MGLGDFADKAKDAVSNNEKLQEAGEQGLDKAADAANNATGDKFSDQVDQGREAASDALGFGDKGDDKDN